MSEAALATPGALARVASRGAWAWAPHLKAIDETIVDAINGDTEKIVVIDAPPRHGKSELVSRWLPAWYLLNNPSHRVILASYGADFARMWGLKAREAVKEWHKPFGRHGARISQNTSRVADWMTVAGGGMVTAGAGGSLTGRGANLLIIDDPVKNDVDALSELKRRRNWDWWHSTAMSRLEPGGVAIIMATRWHQEDLSGRILSQAASGEGPAVMHLHLPAIAEADDVLGREPGEALWPERWPIDELQTKRRGMDPFWWSALYQGTPTRSGRMEWPDEYFMSRIWCEQLPDKFDYSVMAIDPSKGKDQKRSDYSALVFVGASGGKLYVDAMLGRWPTHQLCSQALAMYKRLQPDVVALEENGWQDLIAPEMDRVCGEQRHPPLPIRLLQNSVSKEVRISRLGQYLSRGTLKFRGTQSVKLLVDQLKEFPFGAHDDGPDSLEMAIRTMLHLAAEDRGEEYQEERLSL